MDPFRGTPNGLLELNLSFIALQWVAHFLTPKVVINGYPQRFPWGYHRIELPPGQHRVRVSFPYLFMDECGPAEAMVPIQSGLMTRVDYQCPFFVFMNGTIAVYGPYQAPQWVR
jgi:hypothetical protein